MKFKTPKSAWNTYLKIWTPTIYPQSYPWVPRLMGSTLNPVYLAKRVYDIVELPISNPQNIVTDLMGHPVQSFWNLLNSPATMTPPTRTASSCTRLPFRSGRTWEERNTTPTRTTMSTTPMKRLFKREIQDGAEMIVHNCDEYIQWIQCVCV